MGQRRKGIKKNPIMYKRMRPPIPPPFVESDSPEFKAQEFDRYAEQLDAHIAAEIAADPSHVGRAMRRLFWNRG